MVKNCKIINIFLEYNMRVSTLFNNNNVFYLIIRLSNWQKRKKHPSAMLKAANKEKEIEHGGNENKKKEKSFKRFVQ